MVVVMGMPAPTTDHGETLLEIYDHAVGEVFTYLRARCGSRAVAEDLTADTFLAAVGQIRKGGVDDQVDRHGSDDVWDAVIDQHLVGDVMAELGADHRSALALGYLDGLAVPDVAAHLGRTVEATETLPVRARRKFRTVDERQQGGVS